MLRWYVNVTRQGLRSGVAFMQVREFVCIYVGNPDHSDALEVSVGLGRRCGGNSGASRLPRICVCVEIGVRVRGLHSDIARSEDVVCRNISGDVGEEWKGTKVSIVMCMLCGWRGWVEVVFVCVNTKRKKDHKGCMGECGRGGEELKRSDAERNEARDTQSLC